MNDNPGFEVGSEASFLVTITQDMVDQFVALTGDDNPVHVDPEYARDVRLGHPVVHGMLSASFVSTLVGKHLPGEGALWASQEFQFLKPVHVGDVLKFVAVVAKVHKSLGMLTLAITVSNQTGQDVLTGKGMVRSLTEKKSPSRVNSKPSENFGAVLITGASGQIGSEIARTLAAEGIPVILHYQKSAGSVGALAKEIGEHGGTAHSLQADLRMSEDVVNLASAAVGLGQPVRGLVHCASLPIRATPIDDLEWSSIGGHIDVAGKSLFLLVKTLMPSLAESGGGSVVAISTQATDDTPTAGWLSYLAGKNVLEAIIRSVAAEYGPKGIRANLVSPGMVESEFVADVSDRAKLSIAQRTPMRRLCEPVDIANAVKFLISGAAGFVNGETVRINGGILMR
jgi:3-oxoacyl-[acyl-carrier protein] reductase